MIYNLVLIEYKSRLNLMHDKSPYCTDINTLAMVTENKHTLFFVLAFSNHLCKRKMKQMILYKKALMIKAPLTSKETLHGIIMEVALPF